MNDIPVAEYTEMGAAAAAEDAIPLFLHRHVCVQFIYSYSARRRASSSRMAADAQLPPSIPVVENTHENGYESNVNVNGDQEGRVSGRA